MPIYTTKRFAAYTLSSLVIGITILSIVGFGVQGLFSNHLARVYYQFIDQSTYATPPYLVPKPQPHVWASVNHTIVILEPNVVESILTVKVLEAPGISNDTIELSFDDPSTYTKGDPLPEVLNGNLTWRGIFTIDLHVNDTITILTRLKFNSDARYYIGGWVNSYSPSASQGYGTFYYFHVEQGRIVKVIDNLYDEHMPTSTQMDGTESPYPP